MIFHMWNGAWSKPQLKVYQAAQAAKIQAFNFRSNDVQCSISTGGNFFADIFEPPDENM